MTLEQLQCNLTSAQADLTYARAYLDALDRAAKLVESAHGAEAAEVLDDITAWARRRAAEARVRLGVTQAHLATLGKEHHA